jgi:uncharacterized protein with HEPN domain
LRRDEQRLADILEAIAKIEVVAARGRAVFDQDEMIQVWIVHYIQLLGEAARSLSPSLRERYQQVPWALVVGMRNILVHDYFGIDLDEVWAVVERDLPVLREQIEAIAEQERERNA